MSKPVLEVTLTSTDKKTRKVPALFDSGSFHTIVRYDCLPSRKAMLPYKVPEKLGVAKKSAKIRVIGETVLTVTIGKKMISTRALVSPDLHREMIIGAETMQTWHIDIKNRKTGSQVIVRYDMRDPDLTAVE